MADNLNSDLSRFVEKNGNAGVVTLKHLDQSGGKIKDDGVLISSGPDDPAEP